MSMSDQNDRTEAFVVAVLGPLILLGLLRRVGWSAPGAGERFYVLFVICVLVATIVAWNQRWLRTLVLLAALIVVLVML